jgi:hypothetical protein
MLTPAFGGLFPKTEVGKMFGPMDGTRAVGTQNHHRAGPNQLVAKQGIQLGEGVRIAATQFPGMGRHAESTTLLLPHPVFPARLLPERQTTIGKRAEITLPQPEPEIAETFPRGSRLQGGQPLVQLFPFSFEMNQIYDTLLQFPDKGVFFLIEKAAYRSYDKGIPLGTLAFFVNQFSAVRDRTGVQNGVGHDLETQFGLFQKGLNGIKQKGNVSATGQKKRPAGPLGGHQAGHGGRGSAFDEIKKQIQQFGDPAGGAAGSERRRGMMPEGTNQNVQAVQPIGIGFLP